MHPYYYPLGRHWHRGPSRIVWFAIGALTAAWWIKRKDGDRYTFGHCRRLPPQSYPQTDPATSQSTTPVTYTWPQTISDIPRAINSIPPADSSPASPEWGKRTEWLSEQERVHLANISRQATDAVSLHRQCRHSLSLTLPFRWQI